MSLRDGALLGLGGSGAPIGAMSALAPSSRRQFGGQGSLLAALQAKMGGGAGTPILDWGHDNKSMLLNFASGLVGGKGWSQGLGMGFAGAAQGQEVDRKRKLDQQQREALTQALKGLQGGSLSPEMYQYLQADPEAARQYMMQQFAPKDSDPHRYEVGNALVDENGKVLYQGQPDANDAPKPYTDIGKVQADLAAGLIPPDVAASEMQRLQAPPKPEIREAGGRLYAITPDGKSQDITPDGATGGHMMTPEEKAAAGMQGDPRPFWVDQTGKPNPINPPSGQKISVDADGNVTFQQGSGVGMTTGSQTSQEGKLFNAQEGLARLQTVKDSFKPEYTTLGGKLANLWSFGKSYLGVGLGEKEAKQYAEYTTWRARTANNVNQILHDMSGAAITPQEADRLMKALPNENDDPVAFKAKMDAVMADMEAAIKRYNANLGRGEAAPAAVPQQGGDQIYDWNPDTGLVPGQ